MKKKNINQDINIILNLQKYIQQQFSKPKQII